MEFEFQLLVIPALMIFSVFVIFPSFSTLYHSFTNWSDMNLKNVKFIGLNNYKRLFSDDAIITGIKNSIFFAVVATVLQSAFGMALAVILDMNLKTRNLLRSIYYFPAVLSMLIVGFLWSYMLSTSDYGLINQGLKIFGFEKINFLGDPQYAMWCIIAVAVWQWSGWTMTIYLANIQGIPRELYESSNIDGANGWQDFIYITLPLLFPAVSFCVITGMISGLKVFDIIYAMTGGGPGYATESIISFMMKKGFTDGFYGYACAIGMVFLILVLFITGIQMKYFNKWGDNVQ
jgi:raffinose/stachyose/melibiose transport system permease protein